MGNYTSMTLVAPPPPIEPPCSPIVPPAAPPPPTAPPDTPPRAPVHPDAITPPSTKREHIEWITPAKIASIIDRLGHGDIVDINHPTIAELRAMARRLDIGRMPGGHLDEDRGAMSIRRQVFKYAQELKWQPEETVDIPAIDIDTPVRSFDPLKMQVLTAPSEDELEEWAKEEETDLQAEQEDQEKEKAKDEVDQLALKLDDKCTLQSPSQPSAEKDYNRYKRDLKVKIVTLHAQKTCTGPSVGRGCGCKMKAGSCAAAVILDMVAHASCWEKHIPSNDVPCLKRREFKAKYAGGHCDLCNARIQKGGLIVWSRTVPTWNQYLCRKCMVTSME